MVGNTYNVFLVELDQIPELTKYCIIALETKNYLNIQKYFSQITYHFLEICYSKICIFFNITRSNDG